MYIYCPFLSPTWMLQQHHRLTKTVPNSSLSFPSSLDPRLISKTPNPDITFSSLSTSISNFIFLHSSSNISLQSSPLFLHILMANVVALATAILSLVFRLLSSGERALVSLLVEKHSILPCLTPVHSLLPPSEELGSLTFGFSTVPAPHLCAHHAAPAKPSTDLLVGRSVVSFPVHIHLPDGRSMGSAALSARLQWPLSLLLPNPSFENKAPCPPR